MNRIVILEVDLLAGLDTPRGDFAGVVSGGVAPPRMDRRAGF